MACGARGLRSAGPQRAAGAGRLPRSRAAGIPAAAPPAWTPGLSTRRPPGPVARASLSLLVPAVLIACDDSESAALG